ncbi:phage tail protein [Mesorhizobium sp. KR1-2]|uniref:COG4223 family protein n=1 Tax=Mesorhizobium sp. KR1-2 TaxID=3156609 RepID=UPI0032B58121
MVKTPSTRHSKTHREPVTIELEPGAVSRISDPQDEPSKAQPETPTTQDSTMAEKTAEAPDAPSKPDLQTESAAPASERAAASAAPEAGEAARERRWAGPSVEQPETRRGGFPPLVAGLVGGLIAVAGAGALQYGGVLPAPGTSDATAPALDALRAELAGMRQDIDTLKGAAGQPDARTTGEIEAVTRSLDEVKADISSLRQSVEASSGSGNAVEALDGRIKDMEAEIAALREQGAAQAASGDITALGERIASLEALEKANGEAIAASNGKLSALEQKVTDLSGKVEAQAGQPKVALAIAASALKSAVERGAPFEAELETFAALSPNAPGLDALRAYAQSGVPTMTEILGEADAAVKAMIAAGKPVDEKAGLFDRLLNSAQSLVTVRPVGPVEGSGVPETAARMEFELKSGELDKALAEYDSLPEPAKEAGAAFAEKVRARAQAQKLVDEAVAGAMKG